MRALAIMNIFMARGIPNLCSNMGKETTDYFAKKVIIAGSRGFTDYNKLKHACDNILGGLYPNLPIAIISGTSSGCDALGERYAHERGYALQRHPADWKKYGKAAGPIRNRKMAENADVLIAFWNGRSKGTKNMIETAKKFGLIVETILI